MSLLKSFSTISKVLVTIFLLSLLVFSYEQYASQNQTIMVNYLHKTYEKEIGKNISYNSSTDKSMETVYTKIEQHIHHMDPLKDFVFVLSKAAAAPPDVEVNNSCLPKPLVPPDQLSCEGNQRFRSILVAEEFY